MEYRIKKLKVEYLTKSGTKYFYLYKVCRLKSFLGYKWSSTLKRFPTTPLGFAKECDALDYIHALTKIKKLKKEAGSSSFFTSMAWNCGWSVTTFQSGIIKENHIYGMVNYLPTID